MIWLYVNPFHTSFDYSLARGWTRSVHALPAMSPGGGGRLRSTAGSSDELESRARVGAKAALSYCTHAERKKNNHAITKGENEINRRAPQRTASVNACPRLYRLRQEGEHAGGVLVLLDETPAVVVLFKSFKQ